MNRIPQAISLAAFVAGVLASISCGRNADAPTLSSPPAAPEWTPVIETSLAAPTDAPNATAATQRVPLDTTTSPVSSFTNATPQKITGDPELFRAGHELSLVVCHSCHLYPDPSIDTKFGWSASILPRMALWLGFDRFDYDREPGGERVRQAHLFPDAPAITDEQWQLICNYYVMAAPDRMPARSGRDPIRLDIQAHFEPILLKSDAAQENLFVRIAEGQDALYVATARDNTLALWGVDGTTRVSLKLPAPLASFKLGPDGFLGTLIGRFRPTDELSGSLVRIGAPLSSDSAIQTLIPALHRPTETATADFDGDGRTDFVPAEFGHFLGTFRWFSSGEDGAPLPHILAEQPSFVAVRAHDFNSDGRPDIVAFAGGAREAIHLFINQGGGEFEDNTIAAFHSAWGAADLDLADFNGDGRMDLLVCNGDNGDRMFYPYTIRPYHGVRIYLNKGDGTFAEEYFFPLNGAYAAVARDFDEDGDLDIAAVAYFPDLKNAPEEGFAYLQNQGGLSFTAFGFSSSISGRWIAIDAGDIDGDGDIDIALAGNPRGPGIIPPSIKQGWQRTKASHAILLNTLK